jgi:DNA-binding LacI/PurR family transcriptional regulator
MIAVMDQRARPTVESVARHARVSRQTVSNALNAPHRVRPETLARVLASIDELGYRPNSAARTLRTQSTRMLACRLMPQSHMGTGAVLDRFLHALCDAARGRGYDVLSFSAESDDTELDIVEDLLRRTAVDGYVISATHHVDPRPAWLAAREAPFVAFGRPWGEARPRHSWVDVDGAAGVAAAVEHLVALGHRRIAFLGWPEGSGVGDDRFSGWRRTVEAHRLPAKGLVVRAEDGLGSGEVLTERLLDRVVPPTAIVCVSDVMALGALRALDDRGLRPGVDVAVTGFDDSPLATVVRPGLTSVRQPLEAVAEKVIELLLDHLDGSRSRPAEVLLAPALVVRASSEHEAATAARPPRTAPRARTPHPLRSDR